jgi:4,5-DOPA dioxygenase extradiol
MGPEADTSGAAPLGPRSGAQIVYFSHGGGPLPILGDPGHRAMADFMEKLPTKLRRPEAVLVVSAHWEESVPTLLGAEAPPLFYDYYGFPKQAYEVTYPAPGAPALAARIAGLLGEQGIPTRTDLQRGFDHGLFIPLKMMYPAPDIPCTQLSLLRGLDAASHSALGAALRELKRENILVIGSGFSFHNLGAFSWGGDQSADKANDAFQEWLIDTCTGSRTPTDREARLVRWTDAPSARYCHPREEHLLPLHVCAGMAEGRGETIFDGYILGKRSVAFLW